MQTTITKEMALGALASIPRGRGGKAIMWQQDVHACAKVAAYLLEQDNPTGAAYDFAKATKSSRNAVDFLIRGRAPSTTREWNELRLHLTKMGAQWLKSTKEKNADALAAAQKTAKEQATKPLAWVAEKPAFTATPQPEPAPTKTATVLAVTSKGEVVTAAPPPALTTPSATVGKPGQAFATASPTPSGKCNWRIDPETDDILVTVTKRLVYGSAEHRQKIREIALQLGVPKA